MASNYVVQQDKMCLSHFSLSRQSTIGCSSRIYYRNPEGVPFKWEEEPGRAIEPQPNEALPPLSPPPAFLSSALPKPSIEIIVKDEKDARRRLSPGWVWDRIKARVRKGKDINKAVLKVFKREKRFKELVDRDQKVTVNEEGRDVDFCGDESHLWKFDGEMMAVTPRRSVSGGSSSLSSCNSVLSSTSSMSNATWMDVTGKYHHAGFTCSPRNLGEIMVGLVKRT